jgi:uncharacterized protein
MNNDPHKPWFKQVWPWFLISVPLITVVAGVITYQIAANSPHSMVNDDYFKEGLAINQSLAREEKASRMKLGVTVKVDLEAELISVHVDQSQIDAAQLVLSFSHPTRADLDQNIILEKLSASEFIGQLPKLPQAYWHIRLFDTEQSWLLKNRWHYPQDQTLPMTYRQ